MSIDGFEILGSSAGFFKKIGITGRPASLCFLNREAGLICHAHFYDLSVNSHPPDCPEPLSLIPYLRFLQQNDNFVEEPYWMGKRETGKAGESRPRSEPRAFTEIF